MSKFGDLVRGKKVEAPAPAAPTPPAPVAAPTPAAKALGDMSKVELEQLGRTKGVELDRRKSKSKLIKELKDAG
tara:strand:- start:267 stop:488 length:222 start_codon:yes stop_codon:yes gene_type:complete